MNVRRKLLSLLLALAMLVSLVPAVLAQESPHYDDVSGHWAADAIERWSAFGVLKGDGSLFRPDAPITRGEMAVILDRIMGYVQTQKDPFDDLGDTWYTAPVLRLCTAGVLRGSEGHARPQAPITRQEAAVLLGRAFHLEEATFAPTFTDAADIADWARGYVSAMAQADYIQGYNDAFDPTGNITRASVVTILDNLLDGYYSTSEDYSTDVEGNVLVNADGVTLSNMTISGDLIVAPGVGEGTVTLNNVTIIGQARIYGGGNHSVLFNNVNTNGGIVVNKVGSTVRVVVSGKSDVSMVVLESGAIVVTRDLDKAAATPPVVIENALQSGDSVTLSGTFGTVTNNAANVAISATGSIQSLVCNVSATLTGGASVAKLTTATNTSVKVNGKDYQGGLTNQPTTPTVSSGGNSGGGSSSGGGGGGGPRPTAAPSATSAPSVSPSVSPSTTPSASPSVAPTVAPSTSPSATPTASPSSEPSTTPTSTPTPTPSLTPGWQEVHEPDPRFADGYPQAEIVVDETTQNQSKLVIKVKLKEASAENPVEVFAVVNHTNSHWDTDVDGVLHGHAGSAQDAVWTDNYPYLKVTDAQEHILEFPFSFIGSNNLRIHFVLRDANATSASTTDLLYVQELLAELDNQAPNVMSVYVNQDRDKVYLWYTESLDPTSVPDPSAFALSGGTITTVSVENISNKTLTHGRVVLSVTGFTDGATLSYTAPQEDPLQDTATVSNQCTSFFTQEICSAVPSLNADNVHISSDGVYLYLQTTNSANFFIYDSADNLNLTVKYGADSDTAQLIEYNKVLAMWSGGDILYCKRPDGAAPLSPGGKFYLTLTSSPGVLDLADDPIAPFTCNDLSIADTDTPAIATAATYNGTDLTLTLDGSLSIHSYSIPACNFTLTVNDTAYLLRGDTYNSNDTSITFRPENIPVEIKAGDTLELAYRAIHDGPHNSLTEPSGKPMASFTIPVINAMP